MKKILIHLLLMLTLGWLLIVPLQAQSNSSVPYVEGLHYFLIEEGPIAPEAPPELVEIFSYLCTHCNTFEPHINSWAKRNAETVNFRRIPVIFGRKEWELYARAYVTAQMMGLGDDAHTAMMDKRWKENVIFRSMEDMAGFYADFGVEPKTFLATSKSFAVDAKMRKEQRQVQTYGVRSTPTLVLDGRYRIAGNSSVPSFDVLLDVVDYLIALRAE